MLSPTRFRATTLARRFSTTKTTKTKQNFIVYAPDIPNSAPLRAKVRPSHLNDVKPLIDSGALRVGGRVLFPPSEGSEPNNNNTLASVMILQLESLEECRRLIENDVYYKQGVWDKEKIVILPFAPATKFQ